MASAITGLESLLALGPQPGLHAQAVDGQAPDADALYKAFSVPVTEEPTGLRAGDIGELADLDLWLTLAEPGLNRLNLMGRHEAYASPAQQRIATLMPLGGLAQVGSTGRLGVAAFSPGDQPAPYDITARDYGPSGPGLAKYLAWQAIVWHELGRPGAQDLELSAWPPGARPETNRRREHRHRPAPCPPRRAMADVVTAPIED
jgi:hypothetical protein